MVANGNRRSCCCAATISSANQIRGGYGRDGYSPAHPHDPRMLERTPGRWGDRHYDMPIMADTALKGCQNMIAGANE